MTTPTEIQNQQVPNDVKSSENAIAVRPHTDIVENDGHFLMTVDLPGVTKEDLEITIERNVISISGNSHFRVPENFQAAAGSPLQRRFERSFRLSDEIDQSNIDAELKDGLLTVRLSKSPKARKVKLEVKS